MICLKNYSISRPMILLLWKYSVLCNLEVTYFLTGRVGLIWSSKVTEGLEIQEHVLGFTNTSIFMIVKVTTTKFIFVTLTLILLWLECANYISCISIPIITPLVSYIFLLFILVKLSSLKYCCARFIDLSSYVKSNIICELFPISVLCTSAFVNCNSMFTAEQNVSFYPLKEEKWGLN